MREWMVLLVAAFVFIGVWIPFVDGINLLDAPA